MSNILLLYDTNESDLARDFKDMLTEMNIGITIIPLSANKGFTLAEKERNYFKEATGAIFIITPGSERLGEPYPSPSVNQEIGQAQAKFENRPECIIYLVDEECKMPTINQQAYIPFNRKNIRPAIAAITQLIKDLKSAGLFRTTPIPVRVKEQPKTFDINVFIKTLNTKNSHIISVLFEMSNRNSGFISDEDLSKVLVDQYKLTIQQINFLKRDLESVGVVIHNVTATPYFSNSWWLSEYGWAVVRVEAERKAQADKEAVLNLLKHLLPAAGSGPLQAKIAQRPFGKDIK